MRQAFPDHRQRAVARIHRAAKLARMSRTTFWRKRKHLGI